MIDDASAPAAPRLLDIGASPGAPGECLVWELADERRGISSSTVGGGIGSVAWVINMTVDEDYGRFDPDRHLRDVAGECGLHGRGVGLMTAVAVRKYQRADADGALAWATVGVRRPVWAAEPDASAHTSARGPGTINLVVDVPVRLSDAALVNLVATATEAKVQALIELGVEGTGTASDAVAILSATAGPAEPFGGPRSTWGARVATAVHEATAAGVIAQRG